jgi:hypothetical protein
VAMLGMWSSASRSTTSTSSTMLQSLTLARRTPLLFRRRLSTRTSATLSSTTDDLGVPLQPTWSVSALLESYPRPTLSPDALAKLHRLSALIPPEPGTPAHATLTAEMEDLVKLVEAVRIPELTHAEKEGGIPDGRIWAQDIGIQLDRSEGVEEVEDGRRLLQHAAKTEGSLYVVESDRTRTPPA